MSLPINDRDTRAILQLSRLTSSALVALIEETIEGVKALNLKITAGEPVGDEADALLARVNGEARCFERLLDRADLVLKDERFPVGPMVEDSPILETPSEDGDLSISGPDPDLNADVPDAIALRFQDMDVVQSIDAATALVGRAADELCGFILDLARRAEKGSLTDEVPEEILINLSEGPVLNDVLPVSSPNLLEAQGRSTLYGYGLARTTGLRSSDEGEDVLDFEITESEYEGTPLVLNDTDLGEVYLYESPARPSKGTIALDSGAMTFDELKLISARRFSLDGEFALPVSLPSYGVMTAPRLGSPCLLLLGVTSLSPEIPFIGGATILAVSKGCTGPQKKKPPKPKAPPPTPPPPPPPAVCTCTVIINHKPGTASTYNYKFLGGKAPLGWYSRDVPGRKADIFRSVEYVVRATGPCQIKQWKRDTFSFRDTLTGKVVEQRSPAPDPKTGDKGGHQSKNWSPDGPSWTQPNADGTISWLDTPGNFQIVRGHLPIKKQSVYKVEVTDLNTGKVCCSVQFSMSFGVDGLQQWAPAPNDSLGGPYGGLNTPKFNKP